MQKLKIEVVESCRKMKSVFILCFFCFYTFKTLSANYMEDIYSKSEREWKERTASREASLQKIDDMIERNRNYRMESRMDDLERQIHLDKLDRDLSEMGESTPSMITSPNNFQTSSLDSLLRRMSIRNGLNYNQINSYGKSQKQIDTEKYFASKYPQKTSLYSNKIYHNKKMYGQYSNR